VADQFVNIHAAKTRLSRLIARAEKGERIIIARNGKPAAQLGPAPRTRGRRIPPDDPLLNLETFAVAGPGGKLSNEEIDQLLYGAP
jgi:prevent-host-death family protein